MVLGFTLFRSNRLQHALRINRALHLFGRARRREVTAVAALERTLLAAHGDDVRVSLGGLRLSHAGGDAGARDHGERTPARALPNAVHRRFRSELKPAPGLSSTVRPTDHRPPADTR